MDKVIYGVNFILMFLIARYEYYSGNDKTIIVSAVGFLVLLCLNLLFGLVAQLDKRPIYRYFYYSALGLIIGVIFLMSI
jgi:hypothetical protein